MNFTDTLRQSTFAWRREPWLTLLVVCAISAGVAAGTTMLAVVHAMSADPMPDISSELFVPVFDASPPGFAAAVQLDPGGAVTWMDAKRLLDARLARFQAATAGSRMVIRSDNGPPFQASGRMVTQQFFALFEAPFREGAAWGAQEEANAARVVVLNGRLARKLFGEVPAQGRTLRMDDQVFRVAGVLDDWHPRPLFYAGIHGDTAFAARDEFFVPLSTAMALDTGFAGGMACWSDDMRRTGDGCAWLQLWLRLPLQADAQRYASLLVADWAGQRRSGRRVADGPATLRSLDAHLRALQLVPADVRLQLWLAFGLLAVCIANASALLMARTHRRAKEFSIRRAVGASLADLRRQLCIEALGIGAGIALFGSIATAVAIEALRQRTTPYADLLQIDGKVAAVAILVSMVAALLATLAPLQVIGRLSPSTHLKAQG